MEEDLLQDRGVEEDLIQEVGMKEVFPGGGGVKEDLLGDGEGGVKEDLLQERAVEEEDLPRGNEEDFLAVTLGCMKDPRDGTYCVSKPVASITPNTTVSR